ncbi:MAG: UbiA family prenyltransferase, partial [Pseudomonadota bacterium]
HESLVGALKAAPLKTLRLLVAHWRDPARLKQEIARLFQPDAALTPLNEDVAALMRDAHRSGRRIVLATGAPREIAAAIAERAPTPIDAVLATDAEVNLTGRAKAEALAARFGDRGFDYVGDAAVDLAVWKRAHTAYVASRSNALFDQAGAAALRARRLTPGAPAPIAAFLAAIRPHQWLKNTLVFLPVLAAHQLEPASWLGAAIAFLCFSLVASGVYLVNDVFDIQDDRRHPRKRARPFAAGALSPLIGLGAAGAFWLAGAVIALLLSPVFAPILLLYWLTTNAYTFALKRLPLVDVFTLGGLYTLRVFAGAAAASLLVSNWMLLFSIFIFLSLAIVKRVAELRVSEQDGKSAASGRGYATGDIAMLTGMSLASGYGAALVFALYASSPAVAGLYESPSILFAACPLLLFWISRAVMIAHRGEMHDDPLVFALRDKISLTATFLIALVLVAASYL